MDTERWQQVQELFGEALARDPDERPEYMDQACAGDPELRREVESLIAADAEDDTYLDVPIFNLRPEPPESEEADSTEENRTIGSYKILHEIGRGGLGVVYLAARADHEFDQRVALKLIKRGMDTDEVVDRFRMERQILANLEHPSIARLLDGGTTDDGRPYFVMELVEGERLDRYCDVRRLSIRQRLELFLEVCSAVHFAHRNLVIHRDLKPGNILVTDAGPKLLDFGIAKLLANDMPHSTLTGRGSAPLTPEFASPEQVCGGAITTASDVYSLGVILYRLLTGHSPYRLAGASPMDRYRQICEEEPKKPSTVIRHRQDTATADGTAAVTPESVSSTREGTPAKLRRRLAGDLDSIVLKALRKRPELRYSSVERLAEDIRRHLDGLPVSARDGTVLYRGAKFLRRNRWRSAAVVAVAAGLGAGAWVRAQSARDIAIAEVEVRVAEEREKAFRRDLLRNLFTAADLDRSFTVRELLDRGVSNLRANLEDDDALATQLEIMALTFNDLGRRDEARVLLEDTLELRQQLHRDDHPLLARALNNLAGSHYRAGHYTEAEELYRDALDMRRRLGQEEVELVTVMSNLAASLMHQGEYVRSQELYERALAIRRREADRPDDPKVASSLLSLGVLHYVRGEFDRAEPLQREALEIRLRRHGPRDERVATAQSSLGRVLHARGRLAEAEALLSEALATRLKLHGDDHEHAALTRKDLAAVFLAAGRHADGEELLALALPVLREKRPAGSLEVADAESLWGAYLTEEGRYQEAEPWLLESYRRIERLRGENAVYTRNAHRRLVDLYRRQDRPLPAWLNAAPEAARLE